MANSFKPLHGDQTLEMLTGLFQASLMMPKQLTAKKDSLPLTIISGFLGAGKTTLVNRLLSGDHGRRLAILVNDFGSINIDYELIRLRSADTISLSNGCACCTVAGDLTRTLVTLVEREDPPDAIVLEASGIADPRGIAQIALANPVLSLEGILSLVDAGTFLDLMADPAVSPIVEAQLTAADFIVLNKLDLLSEAKNAVFDRVRKLAPKRPILEAEHSNVSAEVVLGISTQRSGILTCSIEQSHAKAFRSWSGSWNVVFDRGRLSSALLRLPESVIRAKGYFCCASDQTPRYVYQKVGRRSSLCPEPSAGTQDCVSRFVAISPAVKFSADQISALFADCMAD